jgi:radical SAM superfamily enzyme YgiQ (UPF0313 family)
VKKSFDVDGYKRVFCEQVIMSEMMKRILFLQLPRLENSTGSEEENLPLAGFYLAHSLKRTEAGRNCAFKFLQPDEDALDNGHLVRAIMKWHPDIICATLYLWNIERTLNILKRIKAIHQEIKIVCGGPEVAPDHPFIFQEKIADALVTGEGEAVLSEIIKIFQGGGRTDYKQVAWKIGDNYIFGKNEAPVLELKEILPPADDPGWRPDEDGMAYMETGRGCPLRCSYCRYPQMRRKPTFLKTGDVLERVRVLKGRGASQIRFIDPTFNANPEFRQILDGLKIINKQHKIRFFAELHADDLDGRDITDLAAAGFSEIESGVQSRDKEVLRLIHRPTDTEGIERNVRLMIQAGIRVTVDLMYGLPSQRLEDVTSSFLWARKFKKAHIQCMQTLLLPGTELRALKDRWNIEANDRPPYAVRSTGVLSAGDICFIEDLLNKKRAGESMTRRFAGYRLPDLFRERVEVPLESFAGDSVIKGRTSKRALIFQGQGLYLQRSEILNVIRFALSEEPNMLWQFVIRPDEEEPLDLLKHMISEIRRQPDHWLDRFAHAACWGRLAARRVFVHLRKSRSFSHDWIQAVEALLEDHFY